MRFRRLALLVAVLLPLAGTFSSEARAQDGEHRVLMSNFRFCPERPFPCDPADSAYLPNQDGTPVAEVYNPVVVVNVQPGDTVTFVYSDPICDALSGCPGHTVQFDPIGEGSQPVNEPIKTGSFTYQVPESASGDVPYFCPVGNGAHARFGMTGVLRVVGDGGY